MPAAPITSPANPYVKFLKRLRLRKYREKEQAFIVEGIQQVWRAVENEAPVQALIVAPDLLTSESASAMVADQIARGTKVVTVSREIFEETTEREHPAGLAAVVAIAESPLRALPVTSGSFYVALEEVGNPGNLGSIIRTIDATGGGGVVLVGAATDPWHPVAVKASVGTLFTVPVCRAADIDELATWCDVNGIALVTTSAHADVAYWDHDFRMPCVFVFGSEAQGLDAETLARGVARLRIPMLGSATSLNLAVSVGVILFELRRRRALS